jgi:hypothetical protein
MATGQGVGVLACLAGRLPGLTLSEMLANSLPVLREWSREDYLDLFSRTKSELGIYDLEHIFWELGGLSRSAVATLLGGRREPLVGDWPRHFLQFAASHGTGGGTVARACPHGPYLPVRLRDDPFFAAQRDQFVALSGSPRGYPPSIRRSRDTNAGRCSASPRSAMPTR